MEYDEDHELTRYVWAYFQHLMTDFERHVGHAIVGREKAAQADSNVARLLAARWGLTDDLEVNAALANGPEEFRRRVLADVFVNRCPRCARVVRTPRPANASGAALTSMTKAPNPSFSVGERVTAGHQA